MMLIWPTGDRYYHAASSSSIATAISTEVPLIVDAQFLQVYTFVPAAAVVVADGASHAAGPQQMLRMSREKQAECSQEVQSTFSCRCKTRQPSNPLHDTFFILCRWQCCGRRLYCGRDKYSARSFKPGPELTDTRIAQYKLSVREKSSRKPPSLAAITTLNSFMLAFA